MVAIFLKIVRFEWRRHGFKLIALICFIFSIKILYKKNGYFDTAAKESRNHRYKPHPELTPRGIPSMTLFVRMAGKLKEHRTAFYCDLFRTAVLFWPASFGKTVVVLD